MRRMLRDARKAISSPNRQCWEHAICESVESLPCYQDATRVAFYLANDGEVNPERLVQSARSAGKDCFLPILSNAKSPLLHFGAVTENTRFAMNRYGILEPQTTEPLPGASLDCVIVPLVGFTLTRHRIGMGGGYYDRTFADRAQKSPPPFLIGLAFECQRSATYQPSEWDVPCDFIVTPDRIL